MVVIFNVSNAKKGQVRLRMSLECKGRYILAWWFMGLCLAIVNKYHYQCYQIEHSDQHSETICRTNRMGSVWSDNWWWENRGRIHSRLLEVRQQGNMTCTLLVFWWRPQHLLSIFSLWKRILSLWFCGFCSTEYCTTFPYMSVSHRRDISSFLDNLTV